MCLDRLKDFQHNKKTGYKIFEITDRFGRPKRIESLYHHESYKIGRIYKPKLRLISYYWYNHRTKFEYESGFHTFPTLRDAKIFFKKLDRSVTCGRTLVIGKIKFNKITARGIDRGAKCIVVNSMEILEYKPIDTKKWKSYSVKNS